MDQYFEVNLFADPIYPTLRAEELHMAEANTRPLQTSNPSAAPQTESSPTTHLLGNTLSAYVLITFSFMHTYQMIHYPTFSEKMNITQNA